MHMKLRKLTRAPRLAVLMIVSVALFAMVSGCRNDTHDDTQGSTPTEHSSGGDASVIEGTTANFDAEVVHSEVPVLLDFGADWCPPCRQLHPNLVTIASEYAGRCKVVSMDVDKTGALAQKYRVSSIPALFIVVDGKQVDSAIGYKTEAQLRSWLDKRLD